MDPYYHDLYIKFKNQKEEILFERCISHKKLYDVIDTINQLNRCNIDQTGKPLIEFIRIEWEEL